MCIEEMMHCNVPAGAVFYGQPRRRLAVVFDDVLRRKTEAAAFRFHELVRAGVCPPANYSKKCDNCSLLPLCLPKVTGQRRGAVSRYVAAALAPEVDRLVNHKP
jgi:CRISPR-associated exonuclease Cas4